MASYLKKMYKYKKVIQRSSQCPLPDEPDLIQRIRDLEHLDNPTRRDLLDIQSKIRELDVSDRRKFLYKEEKYVQLDQILDWQQTCPLNKQLTNVDKSSEHNTCLAFEINKRVALWSGNMVRLECHAMVDSTTDLLKISTGTCSYDLRHCAGPLYQQEFQLRDHLEIGRVFTTGGYRLPANYVMHVNGPSRSMQKDESERHLKQCYIGCLEEMVKLGCRSLVFPCISTGGKGLKRKLAARTALTTVHDWLQRNYMLVDKIVFCTYDDKNKRIYKEIMPDHFPVYVHSRPVSKLPIEILRMDSQSIEIFKKALADGKHLVQNIRVMLVGDSGVGKTTLLKRLLGQDVDINQRDSTEGIEVHVQRCKIDIDTGQWQLCDGGASDPYETLVSSIMPLLTVQPESEQPPIQESASTSDEDEDKITYNEFLMLPYAPADDNMSEVDVDAVPGDIQQSYVEPKMAQQLQDVIKGCENLSDSNFANVSFWDFAGQSIFYNTHQVFLAHRTVYLLVTSMELGVDEATTEKKVHDLIELWVNSIHYFCGKDDSHPRVPPVILVATHADKLDQNQKKVLIYNHFQKVRDIFANKVTAEHIMDDLEFAVDNTGADPTLEELRTAIFDVAKTQYYWQEEHPVRWLTLEKELSIKGNSGENVLRLGDLKDINRMLPVPLEDAELDLFLHFESDLGNLLYISEEKLKDYVLLNPQWVADAFKCIITAERFVNRKSMLREHWKKAKETGKVSRNIIEAVWRDKVSENFLDHKEFLLLLMQRLHLIAMPKDTDQPSSHYFVPCLITERPRCLPIPFKGEATSVLTLSAASRFFPLTLFHKLIASCIQKYPIHKERIYDNSALFEDGVHVFTVLYVDNTVKVWVNNLDNAIPESKVCQRVLKFLIECINQLLQLSGSKTPSVAIFICCPEVEVYSVQGMHQLPNNIDLWQTQSREKVLCSNERCESHSISMGDALKHWIPGSKNAEVLGQTYKKALAKARIALVEEMDSGELLEIFIEKELLSPRAIRDLREEKNTSQRNRAILEKVSIMGPEKYNMFKECLKVIKQEHLANLLHKYEREIAAHDEADAIVTPDKEIAA